MPALDGMGVQKVKDGEPVWTLAAPALPDKEAEARRIQNLAAAEPSWREKETVFVVVNADPDANTGRALQRIGGTVTGKSDAGWAVQWDELASKEKPTIPDADVGQTPGAVYGEYNGPSLTGHAFDRVTPGLGKWLVTFACWLFAFSTIISWNYYGEQGMIFVFGENRLAVFVYRLVYCLCVVLACLPAVIPNEKQLDNITTLGTGVMLWVNIPLMLIFGATAMAAYRNYMGRLRRGEMHDELPPSERGQPGDI